MATHVRVPGFTPSVNGLHFVNSFASQPVIAVDMPPFGKIGIGDASNGLCGGMVFTVCDVAATPGMAPIPDAAPPTEGSPLFGYIAARLIDSFDLPRLGFMKYYDWMITPDHDTGWPPFFLRRGLAWKTIVDEWPHAIRPSLDAGRLCPLGLVTVASQDPSQLGHNHQVLAYGYDLDDAENLTLLIYDPNTPQSTADDVRIAFSLADPSNTTAISHNVAIGNPIRGVMGVPYRYNDPTGLRAPAPVALAPAGPRGFAANASDERLLDAFRLVVTVTPKRIRGDAPTSITVAATDAETGKPVRGSVNIGGASVGTTGVPFAYTFFTGPAKPPTPGRRSGGGRGGRAKAAAPVTAGPAHPTGYVLAPGYLPGYIEFSVR